jgi:hypothetical protein
MRDSLYRQWMKRLQDFLAAPPKRGTASRTVSTPRG